MICFACIAMMVIFTTDVVPFEWQIPGWNWALIIPLSLVVGCHILVPVRLAFFFFFFGPEKCIYSVFVLPSADRAEPVVDDFLVLRYPSTRLGSCLGYLSPNSKFLPILNLFHCCRSLYKWTSVDMDICNDIIAISPRTYTYTFHSFLIFN